MNIINLTQHSATREQILDGVIDLPTSGDDNFSELKSYLIFEGVPTQVIITNKAICIAGIAYRWKLKVIRDMLSGEWNSGANNYPGLCNLKELDLANKFNFRAMIGGAPYLMAELEKELYKVGVTPIYSYSDRISVETITDSGETIKTSVFKHLGFVSA